jgi:hypothetical protein
MGTKFLKVFCDENGTGSGGEYCGDNDAQLGRINVFCHQAAGGKYASRAVFFELDPGVIDAETLSRRSANSSARATSCTKRRARATTGLWPTTLTTQRLGTNSAESPCYSGF